MGKYSNRRKQNRKQILSLLLFFLLAGVAWAQYGSWKESQGTVRAVFVNPDGSRTQSFTLEVAATQAKRREGLMFRKELKKDHGMLFMFPIQKKQSFWMKDTFVSLDMFFVDQNWKLVGLLENVPVNNSKPRSIDSDSQYVIELNAGVAAENQIKDGAKVEISGDLPEVY